MYYIALKPGPKAYYNMMLYFKGLEGKTTIIYGMGKSSAKLFETEKEARQMKQEILRRKNFREQEEGTLKIFRTKK